MGLHRLGYTRRPRTLPEKQAAAAVGQGMLMHLYDKFFGEYGVPVGQILLTREDFSDRKRFLNARNTMYALLRQGVIPVINENDTVAVEEIKLGDNDNLAALVATLVDAELLILLSDIEGLYDADPRKDSGARLIAEVHEITPELEALTGGAGSPVGTGAHCHACGYCYRAGQFFRKRCGQAVGGRRTPGYDILALQPSGKEKMLDCLQFHRAGPHLRG
jgi:glutamate 5-kinase